MGVRWNFPEWFRNIRIGGPLSRVPADECHALDAIPTRCDWAVPWLKCRAVATTEKSQEATTEALPIKIAKGRVYAVMLAKDAEPTLTPLDVTGEEFASVTEGDMSACHETSRSGEGLADSELLR